MCRFFSPTERRVHVFFFRDLIEDGLGENRGFMFDISAVVTESPMYKGVVGAFIANDELYIMWYIGADPYYYDKHLSDADAIIKSATLASLN